MGFRGSGVQISASRPSINRRRKAAITVPVPVPDSPPPPPSLRLGSRALGLGVVDASIPAAETGCSRRLRRRRWLTPRCVFVAERTPFSWVGLTSSLRGLQPLRDNASRRNQRVAAGRFIPAAAATNRCFSPSGAGGPEFKSTPQCAR